MRFYDGAALVKVHARQPPGGKSVDPSDFPPEKAAYAMRDVDFLQREGAARRRGRQLRPRAPRRPAPVDADARRLRAARPVPPLRRRRVEGTCATALAAEMTDVRRLGRMLAHAAPLAPPSASPQVIPLARYLRPPSQYALPLASRETGHPEGEDA